MDKQYVQLLIENKQKEIEELRRILEDIEIQEDTDVILGKGRDSSSEDERSEPRLIEGYSNPPRYPPIKEPISARRLKLTEGSTVYYCKETRGKRRHFTHQGTVIKKDRLFVHLRTKTGDTIRRTPKYLRAIDIIEE